MAALTAVFDASGDENTEVLAMAGFLSSENDWKSFSEKWSERLAKDGVDFFRAVDAATFRGPFQHWRHRKDKETLRRSLFSDLMEILKSHVYHRFGCVVINKSFEAMSKTLRKNLRLSAYPLAALTCEKDFRKFILTEWSNSDPKMPVRMVFEQGDQGFGDLLHWLGSAKGTISATLAYKKDTLREDGVKAFGFIPLQAADWLAYELGLAVRHIEGRKVRSISDFRWPMQEFMRVKGDAGTYHTHDIRDVERKLEILNSIPDWEKPTGLISVSEQFLDSVQ
jgi:hypothetical protein